jgi:hypothetical protein
MNISFDLDSTLIPNGEEFKTEKKGWFAVLLQIEKIRLGAPELIQQLQKEGHIICIYTTSFRSKFRIRKTLKYYGISVNKIINQLENQKVLKALNINSSKYPPAFNFDVHIDDLKGVGIEGERYGFRTIIIQPRDRDWTNTIFNNLYKKNAQ